MEKIVNPFLNEHEGVISHAHCFPMVSLMYAPFSLWVPTHWEELRLLQIWAGRTGHLVHFFLLVGLLAG